MFCKSKNTRYLAVSLLALCLSQQIIPVGAKSKDSRESSPLEGKIDFHEDSQDPDQNQRKRSTRLQRGSVDTFTGEGGASGTGMEGRANQEQSQFRLGIAGMDRAFPRLPGDVSDRELARIKSYDVVVMQDRSSSMGEHEHVMGFHGEGWRKISRWNWCLDQARDFTRQTTGLPGWAFTLVLFSSQYDVYRNVVLQQIPYIYDKSGIFIGTKLARPLGEQLSEYFRRRSMGRTKPLLVAIITDGKPQDDEDLRDLLVQTTYHMRNPNEIKITFLQVGNDDEGRKKLFKLDQKLLQKGAKYDIVSVKPFPEVVSVGLTKALVDTIQNR